MLKERMLEVLNMKVLTITVLTITLLTIKVLFMQNITNAFKVGLSYLLLCFCLCVSGSIAAEESFANTSPNFNIEKENIQVLIDPTHALTIEDILKQPDLPWAINHQKIPSFGFSPDTYWFRFVIAESDREWILELNYALIDHITMYRIKAQNSIEETIKTGDQQPFSQRPIKHRSFLFPISASEQSQEIILKIRSSSSIQLPLSLWPEKAFFEEDQYTFVEHGLYYGIVLVMALYNFFLFLRLRNSAYAFYVLYVLAFAVAQLSLTGFAYQFIWPESPEWNERSLAVIIPLTVVCGMVFVANFLKLKTNNPRLFSLVYSQAAIGLIFAALSTHYPYAVMIPYGAALAVVACLSILLISYYITFRSAYKYAIYFSAAWSAFLVGSVVLAMNKFGIFPRTWATESAAQVGSAIEIILLSFALAERLHDATAQRFIAEAETLRVNEELINTQKQQNEALEVEVEQRTQDLRLALDKVKLLNEELSDLSTMDQVTGVRNRRYFDEMLDREFRRGKRNQSTLSLIMIDLDHFKAINDNYGHLTGDVCLKSVSLEIYNLVKRPPDLVCRYGGEELAVVLAETSFEGAMMLAERIRAHIEALEIDVETNLIKLTASLGVSSITLSNELKDCQFACKDIISLADNALYKAKQEGRNQVQYKNFKSF